MCVEDTIMTCQENKQETPKRQDDQVDGNGVCGYAETDLKIKSLTQCEGRSVLTKAKA